MPAYRKAAVRELVHSAYRLDGHSIEGRLHCTAEGEWQIGETALSTWLTQYEGEEVTLILASMNEAMPVETRVCRTCGREYKGAYCQHCYETRYRLRGR